MSLKPLSIGIVVLCLSLDIPLLFSEEIYRWTDEKGTTHFTDDISKIPEEFRRETEGIDVTGERVGGDGKIRESEKTGESGKRIDRVKDYLETIDKRIEAKKRIEKKIAELEDEMKLSEERLKWIENYERENYYYHMPYRNRKTGKLVPVASPYYDEKVRLTHRIESIKSEIRALQVEVSSILKSLQ